MSQPPQEMTCTQAQVIAIETVGRTHLVGCIFVLIYWGLKGDFLLLATWAAMLLLTFLIPLLMADLVGFVIFHLFHRTGVPMPLFVRTWAVLFEISLFAWGVIALVHILPSSSGD